MAVYIALTIVTVAIGMLVNSRYLPQVNNGIKILNGEAVQSSLASRQQLCNRAAAVAVYVLLATVSACRIAVGNDYWGYRAQFIVIAEGREVSYEFGFTNVILLMQDIFGYDNYLPIFGLFSVLTVFFFVKAMYDASDWFAYTVFLLLTGGYYFMSFDNVRYYFALSIALYAMKYVLNKKYAAFILWVLIASCFHKSVLLVVPVYIVAQFLRWSKKTIWLIPTACIGLIAGREVLRYIVFRFYPFYENSPIFDTNEISYVNIAKALAVLAFCLIYFKQAIKDNKRNYFLFNLNLFALILYSFAFYVPELTRICYYMLAGQIFLIPAVLTKIENKKQKIFWIVAIGFAFTAYFAVFLIRAYDTDIRLLPYLNWIFN